MQAIGLKMLPVALQTFVTTKSGHWEKLMLTNIIEAERIFEILIQMVLFMLVKTQFKLNFSTECFPGIFQIKMCYVFLIYLIIV